MRLSSFACYNTFHDLLRGALDTMKTILMIVLLLSLLFPSLALAGEIYGDITENNQSVGSGVTVEVYSGRFYSTETDSYGSYSIYVEETGQCTLTVYYRGYSPSIEIYSERDAARYDLELVRNNDGSYSLYRR